MDDNKIIQDYIDKYHAGEIPEADFQQRLESDTDLQQAFVQYQQDLKVIRAGAKEQLKKKAASALDKQEQKKVKIFPLKRLLQIAAALVFLVVSVFLIKNINHTSSTTDLFAAHFELPDPAGERNANPQTEIWNKAMAAYSKQDFKKTIELLSPLVKQNDFPFADRGNLYVGLSQLMQNENQKALESFDAINVESSFVQDAEWFRALAFLKMENLEEAKKAFQKIVDQPRHFKHKEAVEILDNIQ